MLDSQGASYRYREYTEEPLSIRELGDVMGMLGCRPKAVLRKNDKAYKALGLTGDEPDDALLAHMAAHPTLLQRPIGVVGGRAVVGRPVENLLQLLG